MAKTKAIAKSKGVPVSRTRVEPPAKELPPITPDGMIQFALANGRSMAEIKELIDLRNAELARKAKLAFLEAKRQFQELCPPLKKGSKVTYNHKDGSGKTEYWFLELDDLIQHIKAPLSACGLSYAWDTKEEGGSIYVDCILSHEAGHSERTRLSGTADTSGSKNNIQAKASTISYLRRYTLTGILGMSSGGRDDDGKGGEKNKSDEAKLILTDDQFNRTLSKVMKNETTMEKVKEMCSLSDDQIKALQKAEDERKKTEKTA